MCNTDSHGNESPAEGLARLRVTLDSSRESALEEAVPPEMMQVFSDEQWPALLFEFQPSLRIFSACRDVVSLHRSGGAKKTTAKAGPVRHWLIFRRVDEQLVRPMDDTEYRAIALARSRCCFSVIADSIWPELEVEVRHAKMTEVLLRWLAEGLVIDAGVPLPEGAEILD